MDLSEFDGLEPVSEHELKTLIQHLPDGALGLFERRLILRVLELEKAQHAISLSHLATSDPVPVDHSVTDGEVTINFNFGDCDLDVQSVTIEAWTEAMNEHLKRGHY